MQQQLLQLVVLLTDDGVFFLERKHPCRVRFDGIFAGRGPRQAARTCWSRPVTLENQLAIRAGFQEGDCFFHLFIFLFTFAFALWHDKHAASTIVRFQGVRLAVTSDDGPEAAEGLADGNSGR